MHSLKQNNSRGWPGYCGESSIPEGGAAIRAFEKEVFLIQSQGHAGPGSGSIDECSARRAPVPGLCGRVRVGRRIERN